MADSDSANSNATSGTTLFPENEMILSYASLHVMALVCIVVGCYRSLAMVQRHVKEKKLIQESIHYKDVRMFPLKASGILFALYAIIKHDQLRSKFALFKQMMLAKMVELKLDDTLPPLTAFLNQSVVAASSADNATALNATAPANGTVPVGLYEMLVNKHSFQFSLNLFICLIGVRCIAELCLPIVNRCVGLLPKSLKSWKTNRFYKISMDASDSDKFKDVQNYLEIEWSLFELYACVLLLPMLYYHIQSKHWITNNLLALAICISGIGTIHLSSYKAGALLMGGLFVYDIFWVFATDVMVTVAKHIDAPILLKFPHDILQGGLAASPERKLSMLGLGDIVLPGMFIALLLRFGDKFRTKSCFYIAIVAYAAGLVITIAVMHFFKTGQPALLYLVPTCVGIPSLWAMMCGRWKQLFAFSEEELTSMHEMPRKRKEKKVQ